MAAEANTDDQSMEEILQSIKRIIAEEGDDTPAASSYSGSDVLELTEMVQDDGTVAVLDPKEQYSSAVEEVIELPADTAIMPMQERAPAAAPKTVSKPTVESLVSEQTATATSASLKSLAQKTQPPEAPAPVIDSPVFRSGVTVEDLVMEALRPALKSWLDANLPAMVERLVEKEIKKIASN